MLFDSRARTDGSPSSNAETLFGFLDRVDDSFFRKVRSQINDWLTYLPSGQSADVIARLKSSDTAQQHHAFWELYLHEALRRDGWVLTPHPAVDGTTRVPDYLVSRGPDRFYLEATSTNASAEEVAEQRRVSTVLDELEKSPSPDFFLWVVYETAGSASPPIGKVRAEVGRWLATLDPDAVTAAYAAASHGWKTLPTHRWEGNGWRLVFRPYPRASEQRGRPDAVAVGMHGSGAVWSGDRSEGFRRAFSLKAKRYGVLPAPYVLAILDLHGFSGDYRTYLGALYGTAAGGSPDALWQGRSGPRAQHVSAVIAAWNFKPWDVVGRPPAVYYNPDADQPLTVELPWPRVAATGDFVSPGRSMSELFGLPEEWPGPEKPFAQHGGGE